MSKINTRETPECKAAMRKARREAKGRDAITGKKCNIHIHHIKPIAKYPESACDPNNLIPIDAKIHIGFVHNGNLKYLKGLTEEQTKAYMELHLMCEGVRAPFFAIKKKAHTRLGITKKEAPIKPTISIKDLMEHPHKYDEASLPSYLRDFHKKLISEENFKNTHGGLTPEEYKLLQIKCRRQYDIYKANMIKKEAPLVILNSHAYPSNVMKVLKALTPYLMSLGFGAISHVTGLDTLEVISIIDSYKYLLKISMYNHIVFRQPRLNIHIRAQKRVHGMRHY